MNTIGEVKPSICGYSVRLCVYLRCGRAVTCIVRKPNKAKSYFTAVYAFDTHSHQTVVQWKYLCEVVTHPDCSLSLTWGFPLFAEHSDTIWVSDSSLSGGFLFWFQGCSSSPVSEEHLCQVVVFHEYFMGGCGLDKPFDYCGQMVWLIWEYGSVCTHKHSS